MYLEPPLDPSEASGAEREPALAEQLGQFVRAARSAFSSNTERAVRSDLGIYSAWCAERGERALPATPETIAAFVDAMAEVRAPATVRRYVLFRRLSEVGFAGLFRVLMARISRNERSLPVRGRGSGFRPAECIHGRAFGFFGGLGTGHGPIARRIVVAGF